MKLIKIEAHGFKSFADKISLNFDGGVVGIVGPNGSGKSNINDAIRWVLGEQSSKALRGDSMEDVIFAGSKKEKALEKAEVILTFDNSKGIPSIPQKKFTISRVLKRGKGSNEYFINGELARHKDIKEIAMESGISKSSLAIISQGTISNIAEASPEERRGVFEEAAGTSKYKARKIETLRKLEKTDEALEKVAAVVFELEKQIKPYKKQAEKARIFLEKTSELKKIEVSLLVNDLQFFGSQLKELQKDLQGVEETKKDLNSRIQTIDFSLEKSISFKKNVEKELQNLNLELEEINEKIKTIEINNSKMLQRREMLISGEIEATSEEKLAAMKTQIEDLNSKINAYKEFEKSTEKNIQDNILLIQNHENILSKLHLQENSIVNKISNLKSRIDFFKENHDKKTHLFKGTRVIVENASIFKGYKGLVSELLEIHKEHSTAVNAILKNARQNIVVDNSETAVQAIQFLKNNNAGKATFIPLSSIKPKAIREDHELIIRGQRGFVGIASDLIKTKPEFIILNKFLLGNILITENIETANYISKLLDTRYMVVSLDGDVIYAGGVISGGTKQEQDSTVGLEEKIHEMETLLPELESTMTKIKSQIFEIKNQKVDKVNINNELRSTLFLTREKRSTTNDAFLALKLRYEDSTQESLELSSITNKGPESVESLENDKATILATIRSKREKIIILNEDYNRFSVEKNELEKTLRQLNDDFSVKMTEKNKAELWIQSSQKRLSEHYHLTLEHAQEEFKLELEVETAREIVRNLKLEIEALGNVNLDSIAQLEEIETRHNKLKASQNELEEAKNIIVGAIAEMDKIIIKKIRQTVEMVNEEFKNVFQKMFGGGDAEITYTNPHNILETGINIMAQPPGKSVKNLKLFSGGEKALIAISLLFAIIKAKPIPLCILDEVEAALDEANVIRYAEFLQKLKDATQFIVITHRHGTMSRVDHLFGATMQKRGVTSFFSVELSKARELINKSEK